VHHWLQIIGEGKKDGDSKVPLAPCRPPRNFETGQDSVKAERN
jgi:hypothetical protein